MVHTTWFTVYGFLSHILSLSGGETSGELPDVWLLGAAHVWVWPQVQGCISDSRCCGGLCSGYAARLVAARRDVGYDMALAAGSLPGVACQGLLSASPLYANIADDPAVQKVIKHTEGGRCCKPPCFCFYTGQGALASQCIWAKPQEPQRVCLPRLARETNCILGQACAAVCGNAQLVRLSDGPFQNVLNQHCLRWHENTVLMF